MFITLVRNGSLDFLTSLPGFGLGGLAERLQRRVNRLWLDRWHYYVEPRCYMRKWWDSVLPPRQSQPDDNSTCNRTDEKASKTYSSLMLLSLTIARHFSISVLRACVNSASELPTGSNPMS